MKTDIKQFIKTITGLILLALTIYSCNEQNDLGLETLPGTDLINIKNIVITDDISAYTYSEEAIRTSGATSQLLGSFNDPIFGNTTVNLAAQFRLLAFPEYYGTNPTADSVKLFMYYRSMYGDTITPQKFKVYELESQLDPDAEYTQDVDLKSMASTKLLGEFEYTPKIKQDSTTQDTLYQLIKIPLDISLAEKLINADSMDLVNNDIFLEY
ncbi:MAG: DUF4270 family protein, partial [Draconibacterium sp.]|nr:DUF4270 family protein [Draconibacterium sp.]